MMGVQGCWSQCRPDMVNGRWKRIHIAEGDVEDKEIYYSFIYSNEHIQRLLKIAPLRNFMYGQYLKYISHLCHTNNPALKKK